jgi:hypothetical protein
MKLAVAVLQCRTFTGDFQEKRRHEYGEENYEADQHLTHHLSQTANPVFAFDSRECLIILLAVIWPKLSVTENRSNQVQERTSNSRRTLPPPCPSAWTIPNEINGMKQRMLQRCATHGDHLCLRFVITPKFFEKRRNDH